MQINNVTPNQNFGMALKIDRNAFSEIAKQGEKYVDKLNKIGEDLKDCKYSDVIIDQNGKYKIKNKTLYHSTEMENISDIKRDMSNNLTFKYSNSATNSSSCYIFNKGDEVEKLRKLNSIEQYAELSKLLNESISEHLHEQRTQEEVRKMTEGKVQNLLDKFGI